MSLPIGVANSMWPHGDTRMLARVAAHAHLLDKESWLYVNFKVMMVAWSCLWAVCLGSWLLLSFVRRPCLILSMPAMLL